MVRQGSLGVRFRPGAAHLPRGFAAGRNHRRLDRMDRTAAHASAAILAEMMRSGLATGSPRLILSTLSIPSVTLPQTVYWPLSHGDSAKQMKNWLSPESGVCARAMETVPRT